MAISRPHYKNLSMDYKKAIEQVGQYIPSSQDFDLFVRDSVLRQSLNNFLLLFKFRTKIEVKIAARNTSMQVFGSLRKLWNKKK